MTSDGNYGFGEHLASNTLSDDEWLDFAEDFLEKSAGDISVTDLLEADSDRLEDRNEAEIEVDADKADTQITKELEAGAWRSAPSVRNQAVKYPDTIRLADPETKILNLSDTAQLAEYNRIQKASADQDTRTLAITELDRQIFEGSWVVFITFFKVQYREI
jgi:hypothetical protein